MNMPVSLKHYVHRVGRTARAGRVGRAISLVGEGERKILKEIVSSNKGGTLKQRLISAGAFFNSIGISALHIFVLLKLTGFTRLCYSSDKSNISEMAVASL